MNYSRAPFHTLFVLLGLATTVCGQNLPPRRDADLPAAIAKSASREFRDVPYVTAGHDRQRLDLYLPAGSFTGKRPLIVWIHGGGWESGNKTNCPAKGMAAKGYAVASIGYRLSRHAVFPAQIEDCKAAIRWLRAQAAEYQIDPDRIGVWGASAGGHLAALLGTTSAIHDFDVGENLKESSAVQCVIDWFGPTDFLHFSDDSRFAYSRSAVSRLLGGTIAEKPEQARRSSPIYFVQPGAAPFLIFQGDKDPVVPLEQSEALHAALRKAGVESTLRVIAGGGHGGPAFDSAENVKLMAIFLDRHLQEQKAPAR